MSNGESHNTDPEVAFDTQAETYDEFAATKEWSAVNDGVRHAVKLLPEGRPVRALDLGAGTGLTIQAILSHVTLEEIVAVDISSKSLEKLRQKNFSPAPKLIHSRVEDYLESRNETFDLVTAIGTLEFVPDLPDSLARIGSVLREGGALAFSLSPKPATGEKRRELHSKTLGHTIVEHFWDNDEIEQSLARGGLKIRHRDQLPAYTGPRGPVVYNLFAASK